MTNLTKASLWLLDRIRTRWFDLLAFSLAFRVLNLLILTPLTAGLLRIFLTRWGKASVGNFEVASFLLSPTGIAAILLVGSVTAGILYLEMAGLMRLLAYQKLPWWQSLGGPALELPRLCWLGVSQLAVYLVLAMPFLALIGLVYTSLWNGRDLNSLLVLKPPVFWVGAGLTGVLVTCYLLFAGWLFLRWIFALPILLFESRTSLHRALTQSRERTAGQTRVLAIGLLVWALIQVFLTSVSLLMLREFSLWVLHRAGSSLVSVIPATAALITLHGLLLALLSIYGATSFAGLVLGLYKQTDPGSSLNSTFTPTESRKLQVSKGWLVAGALVGLCAAIEVVSISTLRNLHLQDHLQITAHRAGAAHGPENTIAALERAIIDKADWAEIDIQRTQDNALIVLHDTDLARIGGGSRQVEKTPLAEIQQLKVGSFRSEPEFSQERVPTFEAFLEAARGQPIRLTVELKPHGKADEEPLANLAVAAITRAGMLDQCRICSQSYESLRIVRRLQPKLKVGWIAANALGDLTRLDIDFLMLKTDLATRPLVERAALRQIDVHAWTINDPAWIAPLIDRGVDNVITDDPARMRARLLEIRGLDMVERLLLRVRNAIID